MIPAHSRLSRTALLVAVLACAAAVPLLHRPATRVYAESVPVTWRNQVAPIVYANCTACHHTGGSGPFDLTTFASARRWGPQIADVVRSRYMPPWLPEPTGGPTPVHFEGDRRLKVADVELLAAWVKSGMPEGSSAEPKPPVYATGWQMGPPDLILEMPEAITEPASGSDLFVNFVLPGQVPQTRWVRAMEIQPGAPRLVHHANLILDRTGSFRAQHPVDWHKGVPGMDLQIDSGDTFDPDSHLLFWKPDSTALVEPPGMPWRLDPGNDLVLNMHLKPTGKPEQIRARIGLYFTPTPATAHPMLLQLEHDAALDIPAGDPSFVVTDQLKLPVPADVLALYPHAHYLCREMKGWATLPTGQEQPLVLIPSWDIDRQAVYRLAKPLSLPAGTVLHMRYTYDNSRANVHNPASPPVRVHGGNRATDEMSHLWLQVLPHGAGAADPRYALERAWMEDTLRKSPTDAIALYNLGALDQMEGRPREAALYYRRLLTGHPQPTRADVRTLTALGSALEADGDTQGAAAQYKTALALDPEQADAAFDLAMLNLKQGQSATAEDLLRPLLERNPKDGNAADALAQSLLDQTRVAEAEDVLNKGLENNPANPEACRLLAIAYSAQGDAPKALEALHAWADLTPSHPDAHRALAQVLSATGKAEEALAEQNVVLQLAPANPNDWNDLGAMQARAGKVAEARAAFQHALRLEAGNPVAERNLRKLGDLHPTVNKP